MDDHMDDDWESGKHTRQPPYDSYIDVEEFEEYEDDNDDDEYDDNGKSELACPFCSEDFDLVELCCHIDDKHHWEAKSRICPVCATEVGINMAAHIITRHENFLKALCKRKLCNGESRSALSLLRKDLLDKYLKSISEGASRVVSSSDMAPDPLLLSFIYNPRPGDEFVSVHASSSTQARLPEKSSNENILESRNIQPSLSDKAQEEKAHRCEFVHGLLFSTILDDDL
ncbi:unnamed protein product [Ilex paraguariensis]|uniref:Uncharacterized protein n=1 Tax=Ilex paraguariensis TaxID=185542 RepID=A0ABC8QR65_9AQUA